MVSLAVRVPVHIETRNVRFWIAQFRSVEYLSWCRENTPNVMRFSPADICCQGICVNWHICALVIDNWQLVPYNILILLLYDVKPCLARLKRANIEESAAYITG